MGTIHSVTEGNYYDLSCRLPAIHWRIRCWKRSVVATHSLDSVDDEGDSLIRIQELTDPLETVLPGARRFGASEGKAGSS